ncbi:MAG: hypothetical protein IKZ13_01380 [Akkermansia sp.]|nr:hypothetical protein [Akkermansia sp.]
MRYLLLFLLASFLISPSWGAEKKRLLIIGNSYTFYNRLPDVIQAIANAERYPMEVESYTAGAMSLHGFLTTPQHAQAAKLLREGDFDWVLLQDQSQTPAYKPDETMAAVGQWCKIARQQKTKPVLFLTWAHASQTNGKMTLQTAMQDDTSLTYCRAAVDNKAAVAPVGEAWRRWYRKHPDKPLHLDDMSHPTPEGTYLAACVIYSSITGQPATGLPTRLRNCNLRISSVRAKELQQTAAATLKNFTPAGYLKKNEQKENELSNADDVHSMLKRDMNISDFTAKFGKPVFVQKADSQISYQFRLKGQTELVAYCSLKGKVRMISIAPLNGRVEIIDLSTL